MRKHARSRQWLTAWKTIFQGAERICRFVDLEKERRSSWRAVKALYKKFRDNFMTKFSFYDMPRGIHWFAQLHQNSPIPSILDSLQPLGHIDRERLGKRLARLCGAAAFVPAEKRKRKKRPYSEAVIASAAKAIGDELGLILPTALECVLLRQLRADRRARITDPVYYKLPDDPGKLDSLLARIRRISGVHVYEKTKSFGIPRNGIGRRWVSVTLPSGIKTEELRGDLYNNRDFEEDPFPQLTRLPILRTTKLTGETRPDVERWQRALGTALAKRQYSTASQGSRELWDDGRPKVQDFRRRAPPDFSDAGVPVSIAERAETESLRRKIWNSSLTPAFVTKAMVKVVLQVCPSPGDQAPSSDAVCRRLTCLALLRWLQAQARAWPDGIVDIPSDWFPLSKGNTRGAPGSGEGRLTLEPLIKLRVLSVHESHTRDTSSATRYSLNLPDEQWVPDLDLTVVEQMLANSDNLVLKDLEVLTKPRSNRWA